MPGLTLLGASLTGVAVRQEPARTNLFAPNTVLTGPEGTALTPRPEAVQAPGRAGEAIPLGVVDGTFGWADRVPSAGSHSYRVHRTDLLTGRAVLDGVVPAPVAFTGTSWLSYAADPAGGGGTTGADTSPGTRDRTLLRYAIDSRDDGRLTGSVLADGMSGEVALAADPDGVLLATTDLPDTTTGTTGDSAGRQYHLDLIDLTDGSVRHVLDTTDVISEVALGPTTIAWDTRTGGGRSINRQPRAGGGSITFTEPNQYAEGSPLVVDDGGDVGYLVLDPAGAFLRVISGSTARAVPLAQGVSGLAAVGDRFLTAVGGPPATAGVYSVQANTDTGTTPGPGARVATVPAAELPVLSLAFSDGQLYYTDRAAGDPRGLPVWRRTVSAVGTGGPTLSGESLLVQRAAVRSGIGGQISFSAGRGSVSAGQDGVYQWRLLDRGAVTGTIRQPLKRNVWGSVYDRRSQTSGPYTLVGGEVYRADGELMFSEPEPATESDNPDDLFGADVIYSAAGTNGRFDIWLADVEKPLSAFNPRRLNDSPCDYPQQVAVWGPTVAWPACHADAIVVRDLTARTTRTVPAANFDAHDELVLGEGTLAWQDFDRLSLLDLTSARSTPLHLRGDSTSVALDDHLLARRLAEDARLTVSRLPFRSARPARLIGTYAAAGFTPDGTDNRTWAPEFDAGKPLESVTLRLSDPNTGRKVRTLTGTGPDGSVRDLIWDGRDDEGQSLPTGQYRWQLTGTAADGEGDLIGPDGRAITGTVTLG